MEFYEEILMHELRGGQSGIIVDTDQILHYACYQALEEIRAVLSEGSLNDAECFARIEEIVRIFERRGISCGARHDF